MKWVKRIVTTVCVVFLMWLAVSYVDVVTTNNNQDAELASWNFFTISEKN